MGGALLSARKYGSSEEISGLESPGVLMAPLPELVLEADQSLLADMDNYTLKGRDRYETRLEKDKSRPVGRSIRHWRLLAQCHRVKAEIQFQETD